MIHFFQNYFRDKYIKNLFLTCVVIKSLGLLRIILQQLIISKNSVL
jgi:hypothetical protein